MKEIINVEIGGVLNPLVTIEGKIKYNSTIIVKVDNKIIDISNYYDYNFYTVFKNIIKKGLIYVRASFSVDKNAKNIKIIIKNENNEQIITKNINYLIRIKNKLKNIFKKIFRIFKNILKSIWILWKRYKFLIPLTDLKKYLSSFKSRINYTSPTSLSPFSRKQYNIWLNNQKEEEKGNFKYNPLISIIIPVYNISKEYLSECINSVLNQTYQNFEICIADDHSTNEETINILKEYSKKDSRIKIVYRKENGMISLASNSAIELANGEFIALLDNDDFLDKNALYYAVKELNSDKDIDMLYTDEDKIDDRGFNNPHFKPDYSPDTLMSVNYICHFTILRKSIVDELGGFRKEYDGAQDYDLFLRFVEKTNKIVHISKILYHWRIISSSTASNINNKNYAYLAGKRAIEDALKRRSLIGEVELVESVKLYNVHYKLEKEPLISIIIPTKDKSSILKKCIDSIIEKTDYKNYEIIIIDNNSIEQNTFDFLNNYTNKHKNIKVLKLNCEFNYSYLNNEAVKIAKGKYIVLLNNDIEIISNNWLRRMVGYASLQHIGCVGAKLLYPGDTIQHAGVIVGCEGLATHIYRGTIDKGGIGYFGRLILPYNFSAVTGACLMIEKSKYIKLGCLDENLKISDNDIDLCLKALQNKLYNVLLPDVKLYHYESVSRGYDTNGEKFQRLKKENEYMVQKWKDNIMNDKFYNINLSKRLPFYLEDVE